MCLLPDVCSCYVIRNASLSVARSEQFVAFRNLPHVFFQYFFSFFSFFFFFFFFVLEGGG